MTQFWNLHTSATLATSNRGRDTLPLMPRGHKVLLFICVLIFAPPFAIGCAKEAGYLITGREQKLGFWGL